MLDFISHKKGDDSVGGCFFKKKKEERVSPIISETFKRFTTAVSSIGSIIN